VSGQGIDYQSEIIDGHADHLRTERLQEPSGRRIARILDCDPVTWPEQYPGDDVDSLLDAARDGDIVGRRVHAARDTDVAGNSLAQAVMAGGVAVHSGRDFLGP
jgi:hypothetical protein